MSRREPHVRPPTYGTEEASVRSHGERRAMDQTATEPEPEPEPELDIGPPYKKPQANDSRFNQQVLVDTTPMPADIPAVTEIGATSAPLTSAAYFIGDRCKAFNDDFMKCKAESNGRGEFDCLKEGRKVTRCAASVIKDINANCLKQFTAHWECLENNNHHLWECRKQEMELNNCVFEKLGLKKTIPGAPENQTPVHLRPKQTFAQYPGPQW